MAKYIDQDALVSALEDICGGSGVGLMVKEEMLHIARTFPATEVQEVVRCKDCKYRVPLDKHCNLSSYYGHCTEWHGVETENVWHKYKKYYKDYSIVEPDGYCSFGERKEEVE